MITKTERKRKLLDISNAGSDNTMMHPMISITCGEILLDVHEKSAQAASDATDCAETMTAVRDSVYPRSSATVASTLITPAAKPRIRFA